MGRKRKTHPEKQASEMALFLYRRKQRFSVAPLCTVSFCIMCAEVGRLNVDEQIHIFLTYQFRDIEQMVRNQLSTGK